MNKKYLFIFILLGMVLNFRNPNTFALQSGGVEIGDLGTGSVVGQPFIELDVDVNLTAICVGGHKIWHPPISSLDLSSKPINSPVLIKVTNHLPIAQGLNLFEDAAVVGPNTVKVRITVNPGDSMYIGIPRSDLAFVTGGRVFKYDSHTDSKMLGGQLVIK